MLSNFALSCGCNCEVPVLPDIEAYAESTGFEQDVDADDGLPKVDSDSFVGIALTAAFLSRVIGPEPAIDDSMGIGLIVGLSGDDSSMLDAKLRRVSSNSRFLWAASPCILTSNILSS